MALPAAVPSDWHPCKGCACVNHAIPSYRFPVTDADSPIADHPDLGKLTRSNDTPSPSEEKTLQQMISDSEKRIDKAHIQALELQELRQELLQSITRVDEELVALNIEQQRLSDSIQERKRLLSALRLMPKEVLAHIFLHALVFPFPRVQPSGRSGDWSVFPPIRNPLLSISLVSHKWKDVLAVFPELWSYVNIVVDRLPSSSYARSIGKHISRSGQSPLSISISHGGNTAGAVALPDAVLTTLFTACHRIRSLHIHLPGRYFPSLQQLPLSFPILQELYLHSSSDTADVGQNLDFDSLPHLRVLEVTDISDIHSSSPPWHQITHFSNTHVQPGHSPPVHHTLNTLTMMPQLSVCRLSLDLQPLIHGIAEETTLTELTSLSLSSVYRQGFGLPPVIPFLLNYLTLPALSDLSITCLVGVTSRDQDVTFNSIRHLLERCNSPLTSLSFSNGEIQKDDLVYILTSTPTLQDLRLTNFGKGALTEEILDYFNRTTPATTTTDDADTESEISAFVPCLHTLQLIGYIEFSTNAFIEMIQSRRTCNSCHLESVNICRYVDWRREKEEEALILRYQPDLDVLRSRGLDITVSSRRPI
ncbi:uncharacterized protein EV420DRAFT_471728 [Desarmillaria tabescens]|uniref:F-box domain-containing protein n=1 Tax=Armillaria tabescens TaxID=1929756 RepID=A0AA39KAM6_ARMTA|nr:uncharacterized protein EV420DRAFT_471728 [Desarmillaria tabescens]KAK0457664.1 hypothetical protein EV420DRAFT_471728 [Desarmillaria tabescens]